MASSPPKTNSGYGDSGVAVSSIGFALQEVIACWNQAYEAMARGDLQSVSSLMDQADLQLATVGNSEQDSPADTRLRQQAATAHGLLLHAMQAGLDGIKKELGQARRGRKALRGYVDAAGNRAGNLLKSV
jgi:hypothetical protein